MRLKVDGVGDYFDDFLNVIVCKRRKLYIWLSSGCESAYLSDYGIN